MSETTHQPAPFWRRLAAMAYDSILVLAIWMVVTFLVLQFFGIDNARTIEGDAVVLDPLYKNVLFAAMLVSAWAFFGWFWAHSGQTLGMQAWRLKVQNADGSSLSATQTVVRFVGAIISMLPAGLGYFYLFFNSNKQTLHDRLSGSEIVLIELMEKERSSDS